jgi:hypothetical protein
MSFETVYRVRSEKGKNKKVIFLEQDIKVFMVILFLSDKCDQALGFLQLFISSFEISFKERWFFKSAPDRLFKAFG